MTDKQGLATLPPSTHRDDHSFRYYNVGISDKLLISDILYDLFVELLNDCLIRNPQETNNKEEQDDANGSSKLENHQSQNMIFHDLSPQTIQVSIDYLLSYYINGNRHNFTLPFSGMAFHYRISEQSCKMIIEGICNKANDINEMKNRITTLHSTYVNGINGKSITGAPTLEDFIVHIKGYDKSFASMPINNLKALWKTDIESRKSNANTKESFISLPIAAAKREKSGYVKVKGTIVGLSPVYNMIKSVKLNCHSCGYHTQVNYEKPVFKTPFKDKSKCGACSKEENFTITLTAIPEYVSVVDIELQDLESFNEIERLSVKVFEKNTSDIVAGEVVSITGNLHVIRKNDNPHNKLETVLFAHSLEYLKRSDLILTEKDIQNIQDWKQEQQSSGKNILSELSKLYAPELIGLDNIKKGMLLACVTAGLGNIDNRFPKRLRINVLLIGNPGLAKTSILEKTTRLVPNSQYAGGQSSTGLSLTSQISKEDGGMYTLRFGPVVLAKDSLCAINELGQLPIADHKHLLDCMEENGFPMAKYGFSTFIEAHPSIIASANPINNNWQDGEVVNFSELPTLPQIKDRADLIFILRENSDSDYLLEYAVQRKEVAENYKNGLYNGNEDFLKKHLLYARTLKVDLDEQAYSLLTKFFINMGKVGVSGLPRKLDSLIRITIAIAKIKLKNIADIDDAQQAIQFYNEILKNFNQAAELVKNPRDITYEEIRNVIKEHDGSLITLTDAAAIACERNESIRYYLFGKEDSRSYNALDNDSIKNKLKLRNNWHLNEVSILIRNEELIQAIGERPLTFRWKTEIENAKVERQRKEIDKNDLGYGLSIDLGNTPINKAHVCDGCYVCGNNESSLEKSVETDNGLIQKDKIKISKEQHKEEILTNDCNLQKLNQNIHSHASHTSHTSAENSYYKQDSENSENDHEVDHQQLEQRIQLRHSPNADIFTNTSVKGGSEVSETTEDKASTSNSNIE